jgi:hypothetical protein
MMKSPGIGVSATTDRRFPMSRTVLVDQFEGLGLMPLIILVKVAGIGGWIEALLPQKEYDAKAVAAKHRKEAKDLGIEFGVKRDGMDDTGTNIAANRQMVDMSALLSELGMAGYKVTDAFWFWREDKRGRKRFLQLVLTQTGKDLKLPDRVVNLFNQTTPYCNVWANVNEKGEELYRLDTVNVPVPRDGMVTQEELHISFAPGRYTYTLSPPTR